MSLKLGSKFNRCYSIRIPFLHGYNNLSVFYDKRSTFLLFSVDRDEIQDVTNSKITMFKNLESSKFCETFIKLHNYRKQSLDISNQFSGIQPEYTDEIVYAFNETITLSKVNVDGRELFDELTLYGLTMNVHSNEFLFVIAERQHINQKLQKKIVRTTGVQIATAASLKTLEEYHIEKQTAGKEGTQPRFVPEDAVIKLEE